MRGELPGGVLEAIGIKWFARRRARRRLTWFQELAILLGLMFFGLATLIFLPGNWSPALAIPLKVLGGMGVGLAVFSIVYGWPRWLSR